MWKRVSAVPTAPDSFVSTGLSTEPASTSNETALLTPIGFVNRSLRLAMHFTSSCT